MEHDAASLERILFSVERRPVFYVAHPHEGEQMNLGAQGRFNRTHVEATNYAAIVDADREALMSIVSSTYTVVTNEEAVALGRIALAELFPGVPKSEFEAIHVMAPDSRSYCHVDLTHPGQTFTVFGQEAWLPFLRVTNSYNKSHSLGFQVGFVHSGSGAALVYDDETVRVNVPHTSQEVGTLNLQLDWVRAERPRFMELRDAFVSDLEKAHQQSIPRLYAVPALSKALELTFEPHHANARKQNRETQKLEIFREKGEALVEAAYDRIGANAYALLIAMTQYASRYDSAQERRSVNKQQRLVGEWLRGVVRRWDEDRADLDAYLEGTLPLFRNNDGD